MGRAATTKSVKGTKGDDSLSVPAGYTLANTTFDGGGGIDTLNFSSAGYAVRIMMPDYPSDVSRIWVYSAANNPQTIGHIMFGRYYNFEGEIRGTIRNIENIIAGSGDDTLEGADRVPNMIDGGPGSDHLNGGSGDSDILIGGLGSDVLYAAGNDTLYGGSLGAPQDGAKDYFVLGGSTNAIIMGLEAGDEIIFFAHATGYSRATIGEVSDGVLVTVQYESGPATVLLKGMNLGQFEALGIKIGYQIYGTNGTDGVVYDGESGADYFKLSLPEAVTPRLDIIQLENSAGHDWAFYFDVAQDKLAFSDPSSITWHEIQVDGSNVLVGTYDGGGSSISLQGLSITDAPSILWA